MSARSDSEADCRAAATSAPVALLRTTAERRA